MDKKPEEIWAHPHDEEGWSRLGTWNVEFAWHEDEQLYLRADLMDAAVAAAKAEGMREAAGILEDEGWTEHRRGIHRILARAEEIDPTA